MKTIIALLLIVTAQTAQSQVTCPGGVVFKEALGLTTPSNNNVTVELNGVGLKKVFFVNAFYTALYLQNPTQNADDILSSKEVKVGLIHALRNISKKRIVDMWNSEFVRLCDDRCNELLPFHEQFLKYVDAIKKAESIALLFFADRLELETGKGQTYDAIMSSAYGKIIQRVMVGPDIKDKVLEAGLLGKKIICN